MVVALKEMDFALSQGFYLFRKWCEKAMLQDVSNKRGEYRPICVHQAEIGRVTRSTR